jgi:hypothetical protein
VRGGVSLTAADDEVGSCSGVGLENLEGVRSCRNRRMGMEHTWHWALRKGECRWWGGVTQGSSSEGIATPVAQCVAPRGGAAPGPANKKNQVAVRSGGGGPW